MAYPKMKPCPFCESTEHLDVYTYERGGRHVECSTSCGYLGPACTSIRWAIKHHNAERDATRSRYLEALARKGAA
jgi:Zn ribbon nucleic-acid-binding protein